jgi:hypothetical protein
MRLSRVGAAFLVVGLGCMGGDPSDGLAPNIREVAPVESGLDAWAGRWEALTDVDGQTVIFTPCDRENHFVEVRSDGEGGWEILAGMGGELRVMAVTSVEAEAGGVRVLVEDGEPMTLTWVEPDRTATVAPLFAGERFVSPKVRGEVPAVAQQDCPAAP